VSTPRREVDFDFVIVGSGINALVCAALLGKRGHRVCVLERNDRIGGCIRTEECTLPGFRHDVFSQWYPLFVLSPGYAELGDDLQRHGLEFAHTDRPTAALLPDNSGFVLQRDRAMNVAAMNALAAGDGDRYAAAMGFVEDNAELTFATLGEELWRWRYAKTVAKTLFKQGPRRFAGNLAQFAASARHWLARDFAAPAVQACFAPWVLHAGLSPDAAFSAHMAKVICFSLEAAGTPVVVGGSDHLLAAFAGLFATLDVEVKLDADVAAVTVEDGIARGVTCADGQTIAATRAVICSTTPAQLYTRLLAGQPLPDDVVRDVANFRHGLSDMQIHLALDSAPRWHNPAMNDVAMVHVTPGTDGVSRAVNEATRGLLPDAATIVVGQPCALDPSRAPAGKSILWLQLQELPAVILGDARGEIDVPVDGCWTETVRERYADRIIDRLSAHIPNLREAIIGRRVFSPADLEAANVNLVGGDPYGGDCHLDQFLLWRPLPSTKNHATPFERLYHIGASTHPGPGLGGGSGYAAGVLLR
jgi:phytoene dehydrogenase-like protein